jgi:hypothetical protein
MPFGTTVRNIPDDDVIQADLELKLCALSRLYDAEGANPPSGEPGESTLARAWLDVTTLWESSQLDELLDVSGSKSRRVILADPLEEVSHHLTTVLATVLAPSTSSVGGSHASRIVRPVHFPCALCAAESMPACARSIEHQPALGEARGDAVGTRGSPKYCIGADRVRAW